MTNWSFSQLINIAIDEKVNNDRLIIPSLWLIGKAVSKENTNILMYIGRKSRSIKIFDDNIFCLYK